MTKTKTKPRYFAETLIKIDAPGAEDVIVDGYVTDEIDTWGKRTILVNRDGDKTYEKWYLFDDEWEVLL